MKKVVPFTKTITFRTMIAEITDIEVKHTLSLKETNEIEGDILVDGKYKMTDASQIEEEFHYKLPFVIAVDDKYDTSNLEISIDNFNFEIINEEDLKINVEIDLDGIIDKEEDLVREDIEIPVEIEEDIKKVEFDNDPLEQLEEEIKKDVEVVEKEEVTPQTNSPKTSLGSIFSSITSSDETFSTYHVYIVRESDTLEAIMDKYKINRDELANYNDLDNITLGTKLIIPCSNE